MTTAATQRGRGRPPKEQTALKNAMIDVFMEGLSRTVEDRINSIVVPEASKLMDKFSEELALLEKNRTIHIHLKDKITSFNDQSHQQFPTLLKAVSTKIPVMVVGSAGSGKTYAAEQVAKALDVPFYAISVGSQTSKSDIGGYLNANGTYVTSQFRQAYEHGGVFLMDEIDAGNSNVLIFINAALSSSVCAFPDGMIRKHENFYFVATGNTYGLGANRQYVGRNQIDAATLDRFIVIDWNIDSSLEESMVSGYSSGKKWLKVIHAVRQHVDEAEYRLIISPRATIKGASLLEVGFDFENVLESVLLSQATKDQRPIIKQVAQKAWGI